MKFIDTTNGYAINSDFIRELSFEADRKFDEEKRKWVAVSFNVFAVVENKDKVYLKYFDTREQAKAYVTELVAKINGEKL